MGAAILPVIFITIVFPPWFFFSHNNKVYTEELIGLASVFLDPIGRACLKVYLTKAHHQEEYIKFI